MQLLKKNYTPLQAKTKAEYFCAYQERCRQEVRNKLHEWGLHSVDAENIIANLIEDNFLNEERFAIAYAHGKFKMTHWGKIKIKLHLKGKKISDRLIQKAINQISDEEYLEKIKYLAEKKTGLLKEKNTALLRKKIFTYLTQKGYEPEMINLYLKIKDL